ncbi:MAG: hypothetical protein P9L91_05610, partial [Candidatus Zophobacter franzmannii]|nr:hypothetical protein [Candidatus Zophobacter franzmannii]
MKKLKTCINNNSLEQMRIYFGKKISVAELPELRIKKIRDYTIRLLDKNHYRLTMIFYEENRENPSFLFIKFQITSSGSIRVTELPSVPRIVAKLDKKKMPE